MNTAVATQKKQDIQSVQQTLESMKQQFAMCLPDHIKPERMIRVALTAVQNTPKLLDCNRNSFYLAVLRAAQLGLEPDGILGQAYLLPYGENVQLIPGYKGLIDLARRSGEVSNIIAKEVCKNDEFTVDFSKEVPFVHKPKLDGDRGEITHFWAMARFKDGGFHWDYLTKDEVMKIRDNSSGWKIALKYAKRDGAKNITECNSPWHNHFVEMGKKTAIRRIAKFLPMSVQRAAIVEDLVDSGKKFTADQFGEIIMAGDDANVIDGSAQHVDDKTKGGKLDEFAGKAADQGAGNSSPPLQDWIDDISNAPTAEGVDHKHGQAAALFAGDAGAMAQLTLAKTHRKQQLAKPEEKGPQVAAGSRKLFEKPKAEGTVA